MPPSAVCRITLPSPSTSLAPTTQPSFLSGKATPMSDVAQRAGLACSTQLRPSVLCSRAPEVSTAQTSVGRDARWRP